MGRCGLGCGGLGSVGFVYAQACTHVQYTYPFVGTALCDTRTQHAVKDEHHVVGLHEDGRPGVSVAHGAQGLLLGLGLQDELLHVVGRLWMEHLLGVKGKGRGVVVSCRKWGGDWE